MKSLLLLLSIIISTSAFALIEFSAGGQGIVSNNSGGNWTIPNASYSGAYGMTAELRFNLPTSDWQFGARYGQLGLSTTSNGATLELNDTNISALVAYRLLNTGVLFGPVFTYGLSNSGTLKNSLSSTGNTAATAGSITDYTLGLEIGLKFPFLLAFELGYGNLSMNSFSNGQTLLANGQATNVALSGAYARAGVGFSF